MKNKDSLELTKGMMFFLFGLEDIQRIMLRFKNSFNKIQQMTVEEDTALPFLKETRYREAVNESIADSGSYLTAPEISTSSPNITAHTKREACGYGKLPEAVGYGKLPEACG